MLTKYTKLRLFLALIFVISLVYIFSGVAGSQPNWLESEGGLVKPGFEFDDILRPEEGSLNLNMTLAVITAVASGGGFIATTYFALRDDRRQVAIHQLQIDSLKKEIVHKDLEIKRLRRELGKEPAS
jgi:hypothetical protein